MTDLTLEVARRLAAVPHTPDCARAVAMGTEGVELFMALSRHLEPLPSQIPLYFACTCDREARIAALVAHAVREAQLMRGHIGCQPMCEDCKSRVLRALEGP